MQAHHHYYHFGVGFSSPAGKYKTLPTRASQRSERGLALVTSLFTREYKWILSLSIPEYEWMLSLSTQEYN